MSDVGRFGAFRLTIELALVVNAEGPVLIRGPEAFVPDAPDMAFIRYPTEQGDVPFLPGSSLKGVLRSGVEMLLRGLGERACRVTEQRERCKEADNRCRACLLFGSTEGASVVLIEDGLPWPPGSSPDARREATEAIEDQRSVRAGVGIDRQTGAVKVGPFDYEILVGTTFYPTIRLRNPEPWQAGALAAGLKLLDRGVLRVGAATSRGLGRVRVEPRSLVLLSLSEDAPRPFLPQAAAPAERAGLFLRWAVDDPQAALAHWSTSLKEWLRGA